MRRLALLLVLTVTACRVETPSPDVADIPEARTPTDTVHVDSASDDPAPILPATPVPLATGAPIGLAVPVLGIGPEDLVDTFDDARSEGRVHDALDIMAPRGTPVVAAASGTVARLFESDRGGLTVYVLNGLTVYYYAHLDAYASGLEAGQVVDRGARLGTVGSTGNASDDAPHLHFAVWQAPSAEAFWDGEPLNPYTLLTAPR